MTKVWFALAVLFLLPVVFVVVEGRDLPVFYLSLVISLVFGWLWIVWMQRGKGITLTDTAIVLPYKSKTMRLPWDQLQLVSVEPVSGGMYLVARPVAGSYLASQNSVRPLWRDDLQAFAVDLWRMVRGPDELRAALPPPPGR